ncbi:hypothetical protein BJ994_000196 [Arthrobacter pigmenti]|uniref:Uncharacterized protein n=1 Tax=Arthrobacter pigmenti TaxID=271432 RepID=A0A846RHE8_9MICC|nr:hypothetical protein [Arthrobacter pigmenti]NJC21120.1 hypothetical protein [Arthrobacter pigmenti]
MNASQNQYDDDARLAARYSGAGGAHRVTFGPKALIVGTALTHLQLAVLMGALLGDGHPYAAFMMFLLSGLFGLPIAALGCFIALALGLALRPIANQGVHVLAFFAALTLVPAVILLLAGLGFAAIAAGLIIGTAAAIGRASVWKLVTVHPAKPTTTEHPAE